MIKAKRKQSNHDDPEIIVLVPHGILEGDLPASLIEGHAHWLSLSTSVLEICPLKSIWETSSENWRIDCIPGKYRMHKGHELLIDIRSSSWAMVSELLKPLDAPPNLRVSVSPIGSGGDLPLLQLSVVLPRYGLSFYADEDGELQSHNFRGMVYDENQCIGALFGLVNRLVLRQKAKGANIIELIPRCVLIPEGEISFRKFNHHVCVEVNTPGSALDRVTYQTYGVDTDLCCLTTVGLTNRLFCAYLHALTSGCSTDPLTGRPGTEEALSLLQSASCWSFMKFSFHDAQLLCSIANIYPLHAWQPDPNLRCMQRVYWLDLPANSQHHELYLVSTGIKAHYERLQPFHENQPNNFFKDFPYRLDDLLIRSARRTLYLFPSDSSWQHSGADVRYQSRDLVGSGIGEHRAYMAATIVYRRTANARITKDILSMVASWTRVPGNSTLSLQYDCSWLVPNLPSAWLSAYNLLRRGGEDKWFQLLFTLPAMAFASPDLSDLVPMLVAFASYPKFTFEDPPPYESYTLSDEYVPSRATLRTHVSDSAYPFERSPESSESVKCDEDPNDLNQRQLRMYNTRLDFDTDATIDQLLLAWPCEVPPRSSLSPELYNVEYFTSLTESHFSSCYRNVKLKEHFTRVQELLRNIQVSPTSTPQYAFNPSSTTPSSVPWTLTVEWLFSRPEPWLPEHDTLLRYTAAIGNTSSPGTVQVQQLIATAEARAINSFQRRYLSALRASAESLESELSFVSHGVTELPDAETLMAHYSRCRTTYTESIHYLQRYLGPRGQSERALQQSGQWPRLTPFVLLRFLASNSPVTLSGNWKESLIRLALLLLQVQRARRLLRLHLDHHHEELWRELQSEGCNGWKPEMHPDWLLIQVCCSC